LCALLFGRRYNRQGIGCVDGSFDYCNGWDNAILNNSYDPLLSALPLSLQDRAYTQPIQSIHEGDPEHEEGLSTDRPRDEESAAYPRSGKAAAAAGADDDIEEERRNQQEGSKNALSTLAQQQADEQSYGFYHPAASRPQRTVWIPQDEYGVSRVEEKGCKEAGVIVSTGNGFVTVVDKTKGKVEVDVKGGPPDLIGVVV